MMRIDILTLFPGMFQGPLDESILGRARAAGMLHVHLHNIRDWAEGRHKVTDDYPFGGGPGMVMKPQPIVDCHAAVRALDPAPGRTLLLTPQGRTLTQAIVRELAALPRLILICGHYEGVDERVREAVVEGEISIGDYVVSGGEIAAIVLVDAVAREVPGVIGSQQSLVEESFGSDLLEYPQYTRPADFRGMQVPAILLSGHHAEVARWRRRQRLLRTARRRPDLLARAAVTDAERAWLATEMERVGDADVRPDEEVRSGGEGAGAHASARAESEASLGCARGPGASR